MSTVVMVAVASGIVLLTIAGVWCYKRIKGSSKALRPEDFNKTVARVEKLWVYPLKSAHRVDVKEVQCTSRGFKHDRCWVVADDEFHLLSQKRAPKLATVNQYVEENGDGTCSLVIRATDMPELRIPQPSKSCPATSLSLFNIHGTGQDVGNEAAEWISNYLGLSGCRIYYMASTCIPRKPGDHGRFGDLCSPEDETSFSNFSPVFILSSLSLDELNTRMKSPVAMTRFRPNIVLSGCNNPHEEDQWTTIKIGETCILRHINPGPRCPVTTVDQEVGERQKSNEPLDTLNTYRRYEQVYKEYNKRYTTGPLFGSNFAVINPGPIKLGDKVYIV